MRVLWNCPHKDAISSEKEISTFWLKVNFLRFYATHGAQNKIKLKNQNSLERNLNENHFERKLNTLFDGEYPVFAHKAGFSI